VLYYIPQATKYVPMENEQQEKRDHFWNHRVGSSHTYNSSEHFRRNSTAPDTDHILPNYTTYHLISDYTTVNVFHNPDVFRVNNTDIHSSSADVHVLASSLNNHHCSFTRHFDYNAH
jgi:hypothetical protein